jgi:predicted TIM-barrel fold metal-dependent hydrolase
MQTPWGDVPLADAHVHFLSHRFFQTLKAGQALLPGSPPLESLGLDLPPEDPALLARRWSEELDRHGVAQAAIIASTPGDEASVLAAAAAFPRRFFAYAMVDPTAEHATVADGLNAICLFPAMHRYSLHDPRAERVIAEAAAKRCVIFVHCGVLTVGVRKKLGLPSPFDMRFSNPLDLHAIAMWFPEARFVVPHFGAGMLREALMLADLCPNVYLDTSSSNTWVRYEGLGLSTVFRRALEVVGPGRLLFGTDSSFFPRGWNRAIFEAQSKVLEDMGLDSSGARQILGDNLRGLFS